MQLPSTRAAASASLVLLAALGVASSPACEQSFVLASGGSSAHSSTGTVSSTHATGSTAVATTSTTTVGSTSTTVTSTAASTTATTGSGVTANVYCGGPTCVAPSVCCRKPNAGVAGTCAATCVNPSETLACDAADDCPANQVCCYTVGIGSSCQAACGGVVFCQGGCPSPQTCSPYAPFSGINACM